MLDRILWGVVAFIIIVCICLIVEPDGISLDFLSKSQTKTLADQYPADVITPTPAPERGPEYKQGKLKPPVFPEKTVEKKNAFLNEKPYWDEDLGAMQIMDGRGEINHLTGKDSDGRFIVTKKLEPDELLLKYRDADDDWPDNLVVQIDRAGQKMKLDSKEKYKRSYFIKRNGPQGEGLIIEKNITDFISSTNPYHFDRIPFISSPMLYHQAKVFDDDLMLTIQMAAMDGKGNLPSQNELLLRITEELVHMQDHYAAAYFVNAAQLGGVDTGEVPIDKGAEKKFKKNFQKGLGSKKKPIAFYSEWNKAKKLYMQNMALATPMDGAIHGTVLKVLAQRDKIKTDYLDILNLFFKMNRGHKERCAKSFAEDYFAEKYDRKKPGVSFLPEMHLTEDTNPNSVDIFNDVIIQIKSGRANLEINECSGWYDYKLRSLAPLLMPEKMPEGEKLVFTKKYKKTLERVFKSNYALLRETHIPKLKPSVAKILIPLYYGFGPTIEPLAEHYLRIAESYKFIRKTLEDIFSPSALESIKRLSPEGKQGNDIRQELFKMERLFYGAYLLACIEVGLEPVDVPYAAKALAEIENWLNNIRGNEDLARDIRMMVPVRDVSRIFGKDYYKVMVVLGYVQIPISYSFNDDDSKPKIRVFEDGVDVTDDYEIDIRMDRIWYSLPVGLAVQGNVTTLLDRQEIQSFLDGYGNVQEALTNLGQFDFNDPGLPYYY